MIIDLLIMQPIDLCNLNCSYCYLPGRKNPKLMTDEILDASFKSVFNSTMVDPIDESERLRIIWHSGEPLLAGIDFYRRAFKSLERHNKNNIKTTTEIQSNATQINQEWCDFIKENKIGMSVSIDGPHFLHDKCRKNWSGKGSFKLVMKGIENLRKNNITLRGICVLTQDSLNYPEEIYRFFKENGFETLCLNVEEQECFNKNSSLNSRENSSIIEKYSKFMSTLYDLWVQDDKQMYIREFGRIHGALQTRKKIGGSFLFPSQETTPFAIVSVSKDGAVSTFSPELSGGISDDPNKFIIGNVLEIESLDELITNDNFKKQLKSIQSGVVKCAKECAYFGVCGGGSASNKYYENGTFDSSETSYCTLNQKLLYDLVVSRLHASTSDNKKMIVC